MLVTNIFYTKKDVIIISATFILSANDFSLNQSKILLFGKELRAKLEQILDGPCITMLLGTGGDISCG